MMPRIGIHLAADLSLSPPCAARVSNVCHRFRGAAPNMHAGESRRDFHVDMHHAMRANHRAAIMPPYLHPISKCHFVNDGLLHSSLSQSSLTIRFTKRHSPKICITLHYVTTDKLAGWFSFFACARQDVGARNHLLQSKTYFQRWICVTRFDDLD